jgi:hypothetical protein
MKGSAYLADVLCDPKAGSSYASEDCAFYRAHGCLPFEFTKMVCMFLNYGFTHRLMLS